MRKDLFERRKELLLQHAMQIPLDMIAEDLAKRYECSPKTIHNDWLLREQWTKQVVQVYDPSLAMEMFGGYLAILKQAWRVYANSDQSKDKTAALRVALQCYKEFITTAQSMGILEKKPEEFKQQLILKGFDLDSKFTEEILKLRKKK